MTSSLSESSLLFQRKPTSTAGDNDRQRLAELADFLKSRRTRLRLEQVGLPQTARRRTAGLRREEVALLAGIGVTWYTRLEQGQPIRVSEQVLESLARVLQLDPSERKYLFSLAQGQATPNLVLHPTSVSANLQRMLDGLGLTPAYLMNRRWDIIGWNRLAALMFGGFEGLSLKQRNVVWRMFSLPCYRRLFVSWEHDSQAAVARLRSDYGLYANDSSFIELVRELEATSSEFRQWWSRHAVEASSGVDKELEHPLVGRLVLEHNSFQAEETASLKLVTFTPVAGSGTAEKLQRLLDLSENDHLQFDAFAG